MSNHPYIHTSEMFIDNNCGDLIAELLDFLDYAARVEVFTPVFPFRPPFQTRRGFVRREGTVFEPIDLTNDD